MTDLFIAGYATEAKRCGFAVVVLALLVGLIYGNSFHDSWHFDDYKNIVGNANVHLSRLSWEDISRSFQGIPGESIQRPLAFLTFALNYYAGGLNVEGYHVVNIGLHYLTAVCLFLLLYEILRLPLLRGAYGKYAHVIALSSSVLWAVSPLQVTGVTYIVQRMTILCSLFYIASLLSYVKARVAFSLHRRILYGFFCAVAALMSWASKENGVMLPVSLFLLDLLLIQGIHRASMGKNLIIIAGSFIIVLVLGSYFTSPAAILGGYSDRPFTMEERLLTEARIIILYISLLFYPAISRLTFLHDVEVSTTLFHPWTTMAAVSAIIGITALALWLAKKRPLISFSLFFFLVNHLIESSFIPLELIYEHRNYLPSMFFFVPVATGLVCFLDRFVHRPLLRGVIVAVFALVVIVQGMTVIQRNDIFKDELSLWSDNVAKSPDLQRPHHNLGVVYLSLGRMEEGREELIKALAARDVSRTFNKTHTYYYLGQYYRMVGKPEEALRQFHEALKVAAFNPEPYHAMAEIMLERGDLATAEEHIRRALTLKPKEAGYHLTYATILLKKGWPDAAIAEANRALDRHGDQVQARLLIAKAYDAKHDPVSAARFRNGAGREHL